MRRISQRISTRLELKNTNNPSNPWFALAAIVPLTTQAPSIAQDEPAEAQPLPPVPQSVVVGEARVTTRAHDMTEVPSDSPRLRDSSSARPVRDVDDEVPLPDNRIFDLTEAGDVLVEAGGETNPHFLGFVGGRYYAPENELVDPELIAAYAIPDDGRPNGETYAFAMFQKRITPDRIAQLEALGARVLGFHPHYTLRIAIAPGDIDTVAAHPAIRWVRPLRGCPDVDQRLRV